MANEKPSIKVLSSGPGEKAVKVRVFSTGRTLSVGESLAATMVKNKKAEIVK